MDIVLPLDVRKEKRHKCKTKEGPKARGLSGGSFGVRLGVRSGHMSGGLAGRTISRGPMGPKNSSNE